jgi:hypothetical protein
MRVPHLLILPLLVSVCVAQSAPGNIRKVRRRYLCVEMDPLVVPRDWITKPFPRPAVYQQLPASPVDQGGSVVTRIVLPPEFHATGDLTMADMSGVSMFQPGRFLCLGSYGR